MTMATTTVPPPVDAAPKTTEPPIVPLDEKLKKLSLYMALHHKFGTTPLDVLLASTTNFTILAREALDEWTEFAYPSVEDIERFNRLCNTLVYRDETPQEYMALVQSRLRTLFEEKSALFRYLEIMRKKFQASVLEYKISHGLKKTDSFPADDLRPLVLANLADMHTQPVDAAVKALGEDFVLKKTKDFKPIGFPQRYELDKQRDIRKRDAALIDRVLFSPYLLLALDLKFIETDNPNLTHKEIVESVNEVLCTLHPNREDVLKMADPNLNKFLADLVALNKNPYLDLEPLYKEAIRRNQMKEINAKFNLKRAELEERSNKMPEEIKSKEDERAALDSRFRIVEKELALEKTKLEVLNPKETDFETEKQRITLEIKKKTEEMSSIVQRQEKNVADIATIRKDVDTLQRATDALDAEIKTQQAKPLDYTDIAIDRTNSPILRYAADAVLTLKNIGSFRPKNSLPSASELRTGLVKVEEAEAKAKAEAEKAVVEQAKLKAEAKAEAEKAAAAVEKEAAAATPSLEEEIPSGRNDEIVFQYLSLTETPPNVPEKPANDRDYTNDTMWPRDSWGSIPATRAGVRTRAEIIENMVKKSLMPKDIDTPQRNALAIATKKISKGRNHMDEQWAKYYLSNFYRLAKASRPLHAIALVRVLLSNTTSDAKMVDLEKELPSKLQTKVSVDSEFVEKVGVKVASYGSSSLPFGLRELVKQTV